MEQMNGMADADGHDAGVAAGPRVEPEERREELKGILTLDASKVDSHLDGKVRQAVEQVLNDARRIRRQCRRHGLVPVIPKRRDKQGRRRRNPGFDRKQYRKRNVVERCLSWLKECRRVATRYDKLSATYSAMVSIACIRRLLPKACAA